MRLLPRPLALAFLAPATLLLALFLVAPVLWALAQSLTNLTLLGPEALHTRFVGGRNYLLAARDPHFWNALGISAAYVAGSALVGQTVLGLALAVLARRAPGWLASAARTLAVAAWITPSVVVAILWNVYLHGQDGTLNRLLGLIGVSGPNWLLDYPLLSIIVFNCWRGTAFSMLLFDAALGTIPASYYEAAAVSGATGWCQVRDIALPLLRPQILTALLLITMWTFNDFGPYLLTGGGPSFRTEVVPIYAYRVAFRDFDLGYGAALSSLLLLVNLVLALAYLRLLRRPA